ncbi:MAG TPA: lipopolysaccharide biosynthesis protein [Solirubrobacteraceae bacterium]|nr:lipopolysaccharide biosynthesis protein [Solirubrobacteraceae bacterium]
MRGYLRRLVTTGAAYQFGDVLAKAIALVTIPLYTRHVPRAGYGAANSLLTAVILASIFLRVGVGEAFIRFYFDDADQTRRARIARTATATVAWTTTLAASAALLLSGPLSKLLLGFHDPLLIDCAVVGLWAFTNLEMAYAQLRVDERTRAYVFASGANVLMSAAFTVALVVVAHEGARGLLLGNFAASAFVVLGLWVLLRRRFSLRVNASDLRAMLRFGLPTVPADASVYALQVADRFYVYRSYSHAAAGDYSIAISLATVVFVIVRGFQYAWPPLAYSISSDADAARLYALVTTYFVLATGAVVTAVALLGRWIVRLLAAHAYFGAHTALPWLALGWSLYGVYQVMVAITGRARATTRNVPAAALGLAVNIVLLLVLVPRSGAGLGITGAALALCGAYIAMIAAMRALTRSLLPVAFEWWRLVHAAAILAAVAVSGELLLSPSGAAGFVTRVLWLALVPALLLLTRFFSAQERVGAGAMLAEARRRIAAGRSPATELEAYADDPLRDL